MKLVLPVVLLVLLLTQGASTVCGAQCVQHQFPNHTPHTMAHCHSMMQSETQGIVMGTCPAGSHAVCAIDLLANIRGKIAPGLVFVADARPGALFPEQNIPHFSSASHLLRSSPGSSPLIIALRV